MTRAFTFVLNAGIPSKKLTTDTETYLGDALNAIKIQMLKLMVSMADNRIIMAERNRILSAIKTYKGNYDLGDCFYGRPGRKTAFWARKKGPR